MNGQMRRVEKVYLPEATSDGAGVSIKRLIASSKLDYLDPFLLFDHFGSDNPEEYLTFVQIRRTCLRVISAM